MRKALIVARREYRAMVGSRGFLIGLALAPLMFFGGLIIPPLLHNRGELEDKRVKVVDRSGKLFPLLAQAAAVRNKVAIFDPATKKQNQSRYVIEAGPDQPLTDAARLELSDEVRRGELDAFLEIPADVLATPRAANAPPISYYSENSEISEVRRWIERSITELLRQQRLQDLGVDLALVRSAEVPVPLDLHGLYERNSDGTIRPPEKTDDLVQIFMPIAIMMFMFMIIYMASWPVLECVFEEKQHRISEMMLGSINSLQFMSGKLLGTVAGSITTLTIYIACALAVAYYNDALSMVPVELLPWLIAYTLLAVILVSSIFLAIGAAAGSLQESQGLLLFVWFPMMIPFFLFSKILMDPNSQLVTTASLIPPFTPMVMMARMSISDGVPLWQPIVGVVLVLLMTVVCVWASSRIFRIGILSQGKVPSLLQLARWALQGN